MASLPALKIKMVKAGEGAHLNAVLKMLQDAGTMRAEFRLLLPTLGHDTVPAERQDVVTTHGCEEPPSLDNTIYSHRPCTASRRAHPSPSNEKVQHILVDAPRVGHVT